MTLFRILRRDERGVAVIEIAIILPVLILFIYGIFQIGILYQANGRLKSNINCCPTFRHGVNAISLPYKFFKIGITNPAYAINAPLRTPTVHDLKSLLTVIITDHTHGVAAKTHLALVFIGWCPHFFSHHTLHKRTANHHTYNNRCIFCKMFFNCTYIDALGTFAIS